MADLFELMSNEIAEIIGGQLIGSPNLVLNGINRIENVSEREVSFVSSNTFLKYLDLNKPGLIIISEALLEKDYDFPIIKTENAYVSFVKLLRYIDENFVYNQKGIHRTAVIEESVKIGSNPRIGAGAYIGENVKIGNNALIHSNVSIYRDSIIGDNCIIHAGAVIGSDGFGFLEDSNGKYHKIPQLGNVIIGNEVEIGANTCIDRAVAGSTIISNGVKLDNLVHIAHNVEIGDDSAFASQVGVAGSVKIGKRVRMGGQAGSSGHIEITDEVTIMAQSGVAKSVEKSGIYFGSPIKPRLEAFKIEAAIKNLPETLKEIKRISKVINK